MKITKISKSLTVSLPTRIKFKMEKYFVALDAEITEGESIVKASRELMEKCAYLVKDDIKKYHNKL